MIGLCIVKSRYALPTWTKTVALVREHWGLQRALDCEGEPPSVWAAYRFQEKLRDQAAMVERCIDSVVAGLKAKLPSYGTDLAIDASDMPAYANGQRYLSKGGKERERYSDPDASWGHRSAVSPEKAAGSTATGSMPPSAPRRTFRWLGRSRRRATTKPGSPPR